MNAMRFYPAPDFGFAAELERNWQRIRDECFNVEGLFVDWIERDLYGEGWQVFGLYGFPHGDVIEENVKRCPFTAELIARNVPRHGAAGFSLLKPLTRIQPHRGYAGPFLRFHLGLDIPAGDCALTVDGESRQWANGGVLVFDDRLLHEAWNLTDSPRVVLLVDFVQ